MYPFLKEYSLGLYGIKTPDGIHKNPEFDPEFISDCEHYGVLCIVVAHDDISRTDPDILEYPRSVSKVEWYIEPWAEDSTGFTIGKLRNGYHFLHIEMRVDSASGVEEIEEYGFTDENENVLIVSKHKQTVIDILKEATYPGLDMHSTDIHTTQTIRFQEVDDELHDFKETPYETYLKHLQMTRNIQKPQTDNPKQWELVTYDDTSHSNTHMYTVEYPQDITTIEWYAETSSGSVSFGDLKYRYTFLHVQKDVPTETFMIVSENKDIITDILQHVV